MLEPSLLLTDDGNDEETVTVLKDSYAQDEEGNYVQASPYDSGNILATYPAIVTRSDYQPYGEADRMESEGSYTVTVYSDDPLPIASNQNVVWTKLGILHFLVAQGVAITDGFGCQQFAALEVGPPDPMEFDPRDPEPVATPYGGRWPMTPGYD